MIHISHKAKATLETGVAGADDFYTLAPLAATLLRQAGARIRSLDLGLAGLSIEYSTSLGDVLLVQADAATLCLTVDTIRRGDREIGRQLCFQLSKRLIARRPVRAVFWHPTRQWLEAERFAWGRLHDLPQRFAAPAVELVAAPSLPSIA